MKTPEQITSKFWKSPLCLLLWWIILWIWHSNSIYWRIYTKWLVIWSRQIFCIFGYRLHDFQYLVHKYKYKYINPCQKITNVHEAHFLCTWPFSLFVIKPKTFFSHCNSFALNFNVTINVIHWNVCYAWNMWTNKWTDRQMNKCFLRIWQIT